MNCMKRLIIFTCLLGFLLATDKPIEPNEIGLVSKLANILHGNLPSHQNYIKNRFVVASGWGISGNGGNLRFIPSIEYQVVKGLSIGVLPWGGFAEYLPDGYYTGEWIFNNSYGGWDVHNNIRYQYSSMFVNYRPQNWSIFMLKLELQYAHNALLDHDKSWAVRKGTVIVRPSILLNIGILPWLAISLESAAFNFAYKGFYDLNGDGMYREDQIYEDRIWVPEILSVYVNISF